VGVFGRLVRISFRQQLTYRTAMFAGLVTNLFFSVLRVAVLVALYNGQESVNGLSVEAAVTFAGLTQAMIMFLMLFGYFEIMQSVASGAVAGDLIRPVDYYLLWLGKDLGRAIVNLAMRGIIFFLIFAIIFHVLLPQTAGQWLAFLLSMTLSYLLSFSWRFLINLTAFWTPDALGIGRLLFIVTQFLSGFMMPLQLLPDWFSALCRLTPFPSIVATPVNIFLGATQSGELWLELLRQAAWLGVLVLVGQIVYRAGIRRLVVQGG
jgi:ABC-2 type transport system permease protein